MSEGGEEPAQLQRIYRARFDPTRAYRAEVWKILISDFFARYVRPSDAVLDLGCGYGEFINQVVCAQKFGMDLNPDSRTALAPGVTFLEQDCAQKWEIASASLDLVFTSNFFEHLPTKESLGRTLAQARRALKPGGLLIAMGPNIRRVNGAYWDFWDHHLALSQHSLAEAMEVNGFIVERSLESFLPYTLVNAPRYPLVFLRLYLMLPTLWRLFGKQFLVVARKPAPDEVARP